MPPFGWRRILSPLRLPISPSGRGRIIDREKRKWPRTARPPASWRRDPESNRARRICNPLHNRFAIAPRPPPSVWHSDKKGKPEASLFSDWSGRRVSNSRPQPWQGCALPTELLPHIFRCLASQRIAVQRSQDSIPTFAILASPLSSRQCGNASPPTAVAGNSTLGGCALAVTSSSGSG